MDVGTAQGPGGASRREPGRVVEHLCVASRAGRVAWGHPTAQGPTLRESRLGWRPSPRVGAELMATTDETEDPAPRRVERFPTTEPVQLDVSLGAGSVTVDLVATPHDADTSGAADGDEVLVELAHDPRANGSWADDMAAMLNL